MVVARRGGVARLDCSVGGGAAATVMAEVAAATDWATGAARHASGWALERRDDAAMVGGGSHGGLRGGRITRR